MLLLKPLERELCWGHRVPAASRDAISLPSAPRRIQKYVQVFYRERFPGASAADLPWVGVSMGGDFTWFAMVSVQKEEGEVTVKASSASAGVPAAREVTAGMGQPNSPSSPQGICTSFPGRR